MRDFTTENLISGISRRGTLPRDPSSHFDAWLPHADDELQTVIVPMIMALKADHFLAYLDYTTTAEVTYEIPEDALHRNLRSVVWVSDNGEEQALTRIEFDEETSAPDFERRSWPNGAYYVRGDVVKLYPTSTPGRTLRMHFYRLPNQLVSTDEAAEVTAVDYDTNVVTTSGVPSSWDTGDSVCCVKGRPGFSLRFSAQTTVDVSSPTITLTDASEVEVGDWIALEGDSPIPQIPVEAHPILMQCALVKILESLGDSKVEVSQSKLDEIMKRYQAAATPRVEEQPRTLVSRNKLINHMRG